MMKLSRAPYLLALLAVLAWSPFSLADEALWSLLQGGGQVVLIRHALTTPGVGDPPGMRLGDCDTQRNLNEAGRVQARQLGEVLRSRGVVVGRLLSSPWCRCIETTQLAFGQTPELVPALGNLFDRPERVARQVAELKPLVSQTPVRGNTVLMSHGSTILALTGISPATAELVVLTPQGSGGFTVAGRLSAHTP
jgi:phosphohistidine phosphatase SixA